MAHGNKMYLEEELLSFVQTVAEAARVMLRQGFKEPLLSPIGIRVSREGEVKVGEWEIVHFYEEEQ